MKLDLAGTVASSRQLQGEVRRHDFEIVMSRPRAKISGKRAFDLVVSALALIALCPLLVLVACLIAVESRGPVLFRQRRHGYGGATFEVFKFRTMRHVPNAIFSQCMPNDQRITRIGRFLRKSSLDELPQLINVLHGDMSLVGPRPHPVELDTEFAAVLPHYMDRYLAKPGITGWAQVLGFRGPTPTADIMAKRLEADLKYVTNQSLRFDILILLLTLPALLFPRNIH